MGSDLHGFRTVEEVRLVLFVNIIGVFVNLNSSLDA